MAAFSKKSRIILIAIFYFLCCMQCLSIQRIGDVQLKVCHIYSIIFIPVIFSQKTIRIPNKIVTSFIFFIFIHAFLGVIYNPLSGMLIKYAFCFYILLIIYNICYDFTEEDFLYIIRCIAVIMMVIVLYNMYINRTAILRFLIHPSGGHPKFAPIFGGGVNLEATWIGLMGAAFKKREQIIAYNTVAVVISALYASRAGLIVNFICIMWFLLNNMSRKSIAKFIGLVIVVLLAFVIIYNVGYFDYVFERFGKITDENTSFGRLRMWQYVFKLILLYPLGVGAGNAISALEELSGRVFGEGGLHNVYFQMFVDLGWIGGIAYLLIIFKFMFENLKKIKKPFVLMLMIYILISVFQFIGAEVIIYFILGSYLVSTQKLSST